MVRLSHDRFLVLDDEDGVAAITEAFHDPDELGHVARMEADARFVENEQGVDQGIAEAGGEIDPLDFAATERARGAIESEIAEADFEEVSEAGEDAVAELFGGIVAGRKREAADKIDRLGEREAIEFGESEAEGVGGGLRES
jgi:hypothetical protein